MKELTNEHLIIGYPKSTNNIVQAKNALMLAAMINKANGLKQIGSAYDNTAAIAAGLMLKMVKPTV